MPRKTPDLTYEGRTFGRLTVITWVPSYERRTHWLCVCSCGERTIVCQDRLGTKTKSCGCLRKEPYAYKHGDKGTRLYGIWQGMKKRCYQVGSVNYHNYGGRGIVMCDEWRDDYRQFKAWALLNGYDEGLQIDRIDNNANYAPVNCRWVTRLQNNRNRRNTFMLTVHGEEMCLSAAARKYGISYNRLKARIYAGYTPEDAIREGVDPLGRRANGLAAMNNAEKPAPPLPKAKGGARNDP